jgi:hypothetical protein
MWNERGGRKEFFVSADSGRDLFHELLQLAVEGVGLFDFVEDP